MITTTAKATAITPRTAPTIVTGDPPPDASVLPTLGVVSSCIVVGLCVLGADVLPILGVVGSVGFCVLGADVLPILGVVDSCIVVGSCVVSS